MWMSICHCNHFRYPLRIVNIARCMYCKVIYERVVERTSGFAKGGARRAGCIPKNQSLSQDCNTSSYPMP